MPQPASISRIYELSAALDLVDLESKDILNILVASGETKGSGFEVFGGRVGVSLPPTPLTPDLGV